MLACVAGVPGVGRGRALARNIQDAQMWGGGKSVHGVVCVCKWVEGWGLCDC